ncbi:unnamed protein product [Vitrella brassicaformis CCMP3155]|uniref:Succinate--CoA ligase [ADP-forming] subunit beta, mitochondrial n=2 Tax=Vitrella brassicaformis TaxID=1169539 RepID=A0A0G4EEB4_VITBC|nr:unnamed protein product [Vitrella brassicaformis CCMP3155]|mmetsp:Transcript_31774/g.78778  ORF Transcript_31774/g.78778 Transcript_31774/m.78778 type:complete len:445 (+) Transcript_31774:104-1438(+)|eukprot:CEL94328.1 unnamed protein product [Vitrella brassicaformis CCMP3155]
MSTLLPQRLGVAAVAVRSLRRAPAAPGHQLHQQLRFLSLQEYQSKDLLRRYGINVQKGAVASTADEAFAVADRLKREGATDLILKCQILAGGRGKGTLTSGLRGGVKICSTPTEVRDFAKDMIGYRLITQQTDELGEEVNKVLVHEGVNIVKELYLAIVLDRSYASPVIVASTQGGMDIEQVAETDPDAIHVRPIDIDTGVSDNDARAIALALGFDDSCVPKVSQQLKRLYELFVACDATQVEINPFAITDVAPDAVMCVDAKIAFDDSAKYRQQELFSMEDESLMDPREAAAHKAGLNYIGLDGNIGCLVNGAGLAMATMDIIKLHGGSPANFLDVGGGANRQQVAEAFRILQADDKVRSILVNIFGGIMRCDLIAEGIVQAAEEVELKIPLVVRLNGTNVEKGRRIIAERMVNTDKKIDIQVIDDFEEAAKAACATIQSDVT